ncbi:hypothetical protein PENTCL1PPCAC_2503, partial [Pristionchus entomophagus]
RKRKEESSQGLHSFPHLLSPIQSNPPPPLPVPMSGEAPNGDSHSFVYLRGMDTVAPKEEDTVSIGELPDRSLSGEFEEALRKVSFSSISSFDTRNTYISALDTLREATFPHLLLTRKSLRQSSKFSSPSSSSSTMDSPLISLRMHPPGASMDTPQITSPLLQLLPRPEMSLSIPTSP